MSFTSRENGDIWTAWAKVIIMEDYRKLPKTTKKQKKYFCAAKRKAQRNADRRVH